MWEESGGRTMRWFGRGHSGVVWTVVSSRARHRMARVLAAAIRADDVNSQSDVSEILDGTPLSLSPGRWDVALRYVPAGPERMRLFVPSDTPLPPILEATRADCLWATAEARNWRGHEPLAVLLNCNEAEIAFRR